MKHLRELGLDTSNASMCWIKDTEGNRHLSVHDEYCYEASFMNPIPAFTLQDILEMLPKEIRDKDDDKFVLRIEYWLLHRVWYVGYYYYDVTLNDLCCKGDLLDAAYDMLCWCIENGHIKSK